MVVTGGAYRLVCFMLSAHTPNNMQTAAIKQSRARERRARAREPNRSTQRNYPAFNQEAIAKRRDSLIPSGVLPAAFKQRFTINTSGFHAIRSPKFNVNYVYQPFRI
jgi:hypothetical protein